MLSFLTGAIKAASPLQRGLMIAAVTLFLSSIAANFYLVSRNDSLSTENGKLETALDLKQGEIDRLKADMKLAEELSDNLDEDFRRADDSGKYLLEMFRTHDIEKLGKSKPKMVETRINKATENLFKEFENETAIRPDSR